MGAQARRPFVPLPLPADKPPKQQGKQQQTGLMQQGQMKNVGEAQRLTSARSPLTSSET